MSANRLLNEELRAMTGAEWDIGFPARSGGRAFRWRTHLFFRNFRGKTTQATNNNTKAPAAAMAIIPGVPPVVLGPRLSHRGSWHSIGDVKSLLSPFPNRRQRIAPSRERHTGTGRRRGRCAQARQTKRTAPGCCYLLRRSFRGTTTQSVNSPRNAPAAARAIILLSSELGI